MQSCNQQCNPNHKYRSIITQFLNGNYPLLITYYNCIEPIEQNVYATSSKGVYELTLIEKVSRSVQRFKYDALKFQKITQGTSISEIEKLSWKSLFNNSPLYGADVAGSLFDKNIPWNLREI